MPSRTSSSLMCSPTNKHSQNTKRHDQQTEAIECEHHFLQIDETVAVAIEEQERLFQFIFLNSSDADVQMDQTFAVRWRMRGQRSRRVFGFDRQTAMR